LHAQNGGSRPPRQLASTRERAARERRLWPALLAGPGVLGWPAELAHARPLGFAGQLEALTLDRNPVRNLKIHRVGP
jgi:hypothetical protein